MPKWSILLTRGSAYNDGHARHGTVPLKSVQKVPAREASGTQPARTSRRKLVIPSVDVQSLLLEDMATWQLPETTTDYHASNTAPHSKTITLLDQGFPTQNMTYVDTLHKGSILDNINLLQTKNSVP